MSHPIKIIILIATVLVQSCANPSLDKTYNSPDGSWRSAVQTSTSWLSLGKMTFSGTDKATYTYRNGRILFDETGNNGEWKGHWVEENIPTIKCGNEIDGSDSWGVVILQFNDAYTRFRGTYDRCGNGRKNGWEGTRI